MTEIGRKSRKALEKIIHTGGEHGEFALANKGRILELNKEIAEHDKRLEILDMVINKV